MPEKLLRLEEAGDFHLRGKHVAFEIFNVVRKNRSVEFRDGEIIAQELATIRHIIQEIKEKKTRQESTYVD